MGRFIHVPLSGLKQMTCGSRTRLIWFLVQKEILAEGFAENLLSWVTGGTDWPRDYGAQSEPISVSVLHGFSAHFGSTPRERVGTLDLTIIGCDSFDLADRGCGVTAARVPIGPQRRRGDDRIGLDRGRRFGRRAVRQAPSDHARHVFRDTGQPPHLPTMPAPRPTRPQEAAHRSLCTPRRVYGMTVPGQVPNRTTPPRSCSPSAR